MEIKKIEEKVKKMTDQQIGFAIWGQCDKKDTTIFDILIKESGNRLTT